MNVAQPDKGKQTAYRFAGLLAAGALGCTAVAALGIGENWTQHMGLAHYDLYLGIATGMLTTFAAALFWKARFHSGPGSDRIDAAQTRQRQILIALTVLITGFGVFAISHALRAPSSMELDFSIEFALLALAVAAAITFGVGFAQRQYRAAANDEVMRLLRWRAAQIGYLLAICGVVFGYLASLLRPDLTAIVLPVFLLAAVVVPAVYYLIAEWRASADA
jgi:hypothetical protein